LTSARQLIADGYSQAAVLVAHMACEVFTGEVIVALMERRGLQEAGAWAEEYKEEFSFLNPAIRALYFSVAAERINIAFPRWQEHKRHIQLRNQVSHRGARVTQAEAENVCDVAQALTIHLRAVLDRTQ